MLTIAGFKMKKCAFLFLLYALGVAVAQASEAPLLNSLPGGHVFYKAVPQYKVLELVSGDIEYLRLDDGREGYQAQRTVRLEANSAMRVVDHQSGATALQLYRKAEQLLERQRFETLYRCDNLQCGDMSGWQLYLSDKLLGDEQTQHYVLAKVGAPNGLTYYLQFYVVELDGQPRSFQRLVGPVTPSAKSATRPIDKADITLFFLYNSTRLTDESTKGLVKLAQKLEQDNVGKVIITGHADSQGSQAYNRNLALRRASYVANTLKSQPGLDGLQIETRTDGEAAPWGDNRSAAGREQNRRVTVQIPGAVDTQ